MRLRSGVLPHERESLMEKSVRLLVSLPVAPQNSESQWSSGKGSTKEKREKLDLSHLKPSCRTFPTCSGAYRFDGSRREWSFPQRQAPKVPRRSTQQYKGRNWRSPGA